jgi:predicted 2-oxoglutarate/Fe(II)-dependent dioxygenase YbiX
MDKQTSTLLQNGIGPFPDFTPSADDACFCGSGRQFAACCGSTATERPPPHGVFVAENYFEPALIRELAAFSRTRSGQRLLVIDREASTADNIVKVEDQRRVAERVDLGPRREEVNRLIGNVYRDLARSHFGVELEWYESPELMRYRPGGLYIKHADSQNMNPETRQWTKIIDRDLSLLVYLNDDYEGGALCFDKFHYRLRPRAGMVVLFPSDCRYVHAAEQVTAGERYVIVSWAAARGIPKVGKKPPEPALFFP